MAISDNIADCTSPCNFQYWRLSFLRIFFYNVRLAFKLDDLGAEIAHIAFPTVLALTADPIASLVDTAFIGQIGSVELAAVGVSIAVFNQISRIAIFPLVSVTTSFVAQEDAISDLNSEVNDAENSFKTFPLNNEMKELIPCTDYGMNKNESSMLSCQDRNMKTLEYERKYIPSVTSALLIGGALGLLQTISLLLGAKSILKFMGIGSGSPMLTPAIQYLSLRSLGAPAVLLSLAIQGIFRGFKDTTTPLFATVVGDVTNIILDPVFMFIFHLDVRGAAVAHLISQYIMLAILLRRLMKQVDVLPPTIKDLQFVQFFKSGFLLLLRVIAVTCCVTLATSLAARQGSTSMAAFQICLQIWLATSLLADGLAVAAQAILASAFAKKDYDKATGTASRVLQLGLTLGLLLSIVLAVCMKFVSRLFTRDMKVLKFMRIGIPFVAVTQPINSLAFVFDGINFGASDFAYSAYSMLVVAVISIFFLLYLSWSHGFVGIWIGLTIYMGLRMFAGVWRIGSARGPWRFLWG